MASPSDRDQPRHMSHNPQISTADLQTDLRIQQAVIGAVIGTTVIGALAFVSFAGSPRGSVYTPVALAVVGAAAVRVGLRSGRRRVAVTAVACVFLGLLAVRIAQLAPPTTSVLDSRLDQFERPDWQLVRSAQGGHLLCFDECRFATRT